MAELSRATSFLPDAGSVTHEEAEAKAIGEYEKFRRIQDQTFLSDFDKFIEDLGNTNN